MLIYTAHICANVHIYGRSYYTYMRCSVSHICSIYQRIYVHIGTYMLLALTHICVFLNTYMLITTARICVFTNVYVYSGSTYMCWNKHIWPHIYVWIRTYMWRNHTHIRALANSIYANGNRAYMCCNEHICAQHQHVYVLLRTCIDAHICANKNIYVKGPSTYTWLWG